VKNWLAWTLIQGSNACNILVGILLARALAPYDFGRFATMTASLTIFTALLNPLINELAHVIASPAGIPRGALTKRTVWVSLGGILLSVATCASITGDWFDRVVILLALPLSMVGWSWMNGILIGKNEMLLLGRAQSVGALLRILIVCAVIAFSPTLFGVAIAYIVSFIVMALVVIPFAGGIRWTVDGEWNTNWSLVIGFFLLAAPFSLDQPLIQLWFPSMSGEYAAVMTYAKSIMLLASPALTMAYSSALQRHDPRASMSTFLKLSLFVAGAAGFFWLCSPIFFPLLLGPQYVNLLPLIGYAVVAISCHVISYAVAQVSLAHRPGWFVAILGLPLVTQTLYLRTLVSPSLTDLLGVSIAVFALQLAVCLGYQMLLSRVQKAQ
jgi:O-antigen/teichoic acid export membrane protein